MERCWISNCGVTIKSLVTVIYPSTLCLYNYVSSHVSGTFTSTTVSCLLDFCSNSWEILNNSTMIDCLNTWEILNNSRMIDSLNICCSSWGSKYLAFLFYDEIYAMFEKKSSNRLCESASCSLELELTTTLSSFHNVSTWISHWLWQLYFYAM